MAEITAKLVNELRAKTGQAMMECKKALVETAGDVEKAVDYFRKKGIKTSITERAANEGRVAIVSSSDAKSAALVELNCNTDFTAKSEPVQKLGEKAAQLLLSNPTVDVAQAAQISSNLTEVSQQTGENVRIGRTAVVSSPAGKVGTYVHYTGKVGVIVAVSGNPSDELLKDLCLHITGHKPAPIALTREELPAELVAKEREIAVDQAKATGKPQNIAEKIAEGKLASFYQERVLLDQKFVKDDSKSIAQLAKAAGVTIEKFIRVEVGQQ